MSQLKSLDSQPLSPPPSLAAQPPEPGVEAGDVLRRVLLDGRASVLVLICLPYMSALYVCLIRAVGWACLGPYWSIPDRICDFVWISLPAKFRY